MNNEKHDEPSVSKIYSGLGSHTEGASLVKMAHLLLFSSSDIDISYSLYKEIWDKISCRNISFEDALEVLSNYEIIEHKTYIDEVLFDEDGNGLHQDVYNDIFILNDWNEPANIEKTKKIYPNLEEEIAEILTSLPTSTARTYLKSITPTPKLIEKIPDNILYNDSLFDFHVSVASYILIRNPKLAPYFSLDKITNKDWLKILKQGDHSLDNYCPWTKLSIEDWGNLLVSYTLNYKMKIEGRFDKKLDLEALDEYDWISLIYEVTRFKDKCPYQKLNFECYIGTNSIELNSTFAEKFDYSNVPPRKMVHLLLSTEGYWDKIDKFYDLKRLDHSDWAKLIAGKPEYENMCPWDTLSGDDLEQIYIHKPTLSQKYGFSKFSVHNWAKFLRYTKGYSQKCPCWDKFTGDDLAFALDGNPELITKYDLSSLSGDNWQMLLMFHPEIANQVQVPWEKITGNDLVALIVHHPEFAQKYDLTKISSHDWMRILYHAPELATKCNWNIFSAEELEELNNFSHHLEKYVDFEKIYNNFMERSKKQDVSNSQNNK